MSKIFNYNNPVLSSPVLWLRADKGVVVDSNGFVERWEDQSGNGYDLTQTIQANKPLLKLNGVNNKPSLLFDGVNDFLKNTTTIQFQSLFIVSNYNLPLFAGYSGLIDSSFLGFYLVAGNPNSTGINQYPMLDSYYINGVISSDFSPLPTYKLVSGTKNTMITSSYLEIGVSTNSLPYGGSYWNGNVVEVLIFEQLLNTIERQQIENYLKMKYGI